MVCFSPDTNSFGLNDIIGPNIVYMERPMSSSVLLRAVDDVFLCKIL